MLALWRLHHDLHAQGSPARLILVITGANVWGGGSVKHAGVTVYPIATPKRRLPGKADIPSSKAALPGYKNTASLDVCPIPEEEGEKSNEETWSTQ